MTVGWRARRERQMHLSKLVETDGVEHDKIMHSPEEMDETFGEREGKNGFEKFFQREKLTWWMIN